ncbi:MAG: hypothetical protein A2X15_13940 [Bacteroidetes bacterium GWB2_32_14]|nr:MAG: hypothetical protein A2X15_13940 [Bacteroidetes bacterium GWB2_32_14]
MKKLFLMIMAVVFIATITKAQEPGIDLREKLMIGVKAGLNLSNVYDSEDEEFDADSKIGFTAGAFVQIPIGKFLGFHPEIQLSQKGYQGTGTFLTMPYEYTRTSTFIDVPLLIAFKPIAPLTIVAGPQYSYLIKQKDAFTSDAYSDEIEEEFDNDDLRNNLLCFVIGGDYNFKHIVFGARAGWDIQNNTKDEASTTPQYKNVWYQATIGFRF